MSTATGSVVVTSVDTTLTVPGSGTEDDPESPATGTVTDAPDADTGAELTSTSSPTVRPDGTADAVTYVVDAPDGSTASVERDGTVGVVTPDGSLVLGLAAPTATDAAGARVPVRWSVDGLALTLTASPAPDAPGPLTTSVHAGATIAVSAVWGEREGGRSLAVTPSAWGRVSGLAGIAHGWPGVVALAPDADTPGMEKQLVCHAVGAPDKATWNLEPWRPDVSLVELALARCNPT